jgi:DNA-binding NarL/FixJ family response regulator
MGGILLVDEHAAFRQALALVLARETGLHVAQAGSIAEARDHLAGPAVAVVAQHLPDGPGTELVRQLRRANPAADALLLGAAPDRKDLARAIEAGAASILSTSSSLDEIVGAIRRLAAGEALVPAGETVALLRLAIQLRDEEEQARRRLERITPRERDVLAALAAGLNDAGMAAQLHISVRTARTHVANITAKLGVESRLQALVLAARHGAVHIG